MSTASRIKSKHLLLVITIAIAATLLIVIYPKKANPPVPAPPPVEYTAPDNREISPQPSRLITLRDSTRVYIIADSSKLTPSKDFNKKREVAVDGDMFFEVPDLPKPLIVRSRLLILTVTGKAAFRVIAYAKEEGEEVQVLSGNIRVKKTYKSQFSEPDTLHENQMVMINISIDLMEKEKLDTRDLRAWRDTVRVPTDRQAL
jgi:hypothetical protein